jgi:NADPH:quinone reductase-like Zn-dependent oxidoreductase
MLTRKVLFFTAPYCIEVREEVLPTLADGQVLVKTVLSAISPGTEMLVYRGQFPIFPVDATIEALAGNFAYPIAYGYACVGRVLEVGAGVPREWLGRLVFSFQPHACISLSIHLRSCRCQIQFLQKMLAFCQMLRRQSTWCRMLLLFWENALWCLDRASLVY